VKCPECQSKKLDKLITGPAAVTFAKNIVKESSKFDNFGYAARHNFYEAQQESAKAREAAARRNLKPYRHIDDTQLGKRMNFTADE